MTDSSSPDQEAIARLRSVFDGNYQAVKWSRAHAAELFQRLESKSSRIVDLDRENSRLTAECNDHARKIDELEEQIDKLTRQLRDFS